MAFQFPASPIIGQTFSPIPGVIYKWNGTGWAPVAPGYIPYAEKGVANGVATLDGGGKVPLAQLPPIPTGVLQQDALPAWLKGQLWFDSNSGLFALSYENPDLTQTFVAVNAAGGNYIPVSEKGVGMGVATLDASGILVQSALRLGAPVAAAGLNVDINIPAGAKRITITRRGVSMNGAAGHLIQLGTAASFETTGYNGTMSVNAGGGAASSAVGNGFGIRAFGAGDEVSGALVLTQHDSLTNQWVCHGNHGNGTTDAQFITGGGKTLAGPLTRIRNTSVNVTDVYDAGTINVLVEM